jgi:prepilin-type N-terminal cleavage/methylation domain-containing protein
MNPKGVFAMMKRMRNQGGFTLAEILVVITLLAILSGVVLFNLAGSDQGAKESTLKSNVAGLREALNLYRADHGWYPCDPRDHNKAGNASTFMLQLTQYTDEDGKPSKSRTKVYRFGPYLKKWPNDPVTGLGDVTINTKDERILSEVSKAVSKTAGKGGWYYEAKSGNIVANFGKDYPTAYAGF